MTKKTVMTAQIQLNISVVALVALVAIVGLVSLVLNAATVSLVPMGASIEQAAPIGEENLVGEARWYNDNGTFYYNGSTRNPIRYGYGRK